MDDTLNRALFSLMATRLPDEMLDALHESIMDEYKMRKNNYVDRSGNTPEGFTVFAQKLLESIRKARMEQFGGQEEEDEEQDEEIEENSIIDLDGHIHVIREMHLYNHTIKIYMADGSSHSFNVTGDLDELYELYVTLKDVFEGEE